MGRIVIDVARILRFFEITKPQKCKRKRHYLISVMWHTAKVFEELKNHATLRS